MGLTHNFQKKVDRGKYVPPSFGETIVNTDPGCFPLAHIPAAADRVENVRIERDYQGEPALSDDLLEASAHVNNTLIL